MRFFTLLFFTLWVSFSLQGQITLGHSDFTFNPNGDSTTNTIIDASAISVPQGGANMIWDFTSAPIVDTVIKHYTPVSNPNHPTAILGRSGERSILGLVTFPTTSYINYDTRFCFRAG